MLDLRMRQRSAFPYLLLFGGVTITSCSAVLITLAKDAGAHPLAISFGRLGLAALILTPLTWRDGAPAIRRLSRRDLALGLLAGVCLAIHFAAWIWSLAFTSVASSTALVTTNPIFVALVSFLVWGERPSRPALAGVGLAVLGSALIALSDSGGGSGSAPLLGDLLALIGALFVSGYLLIGRDLRRRLHVLPYIWLVYSSAALILLIAMLLAGATLIGFPGYVYLLLLALALGPQLLGHTSFNWAVKYLSTTFVAVATLGEPIAATLIALVVFPEQRLQPLQVAGGLVLLGGIAVATLAESRDARARKTETELRELAAP
jgi:drug/metabolite transporter (DMT)-like permease